MNISVLETINQKILATTFLTNSRFYMHQKMMFKTTTVCKINESLRILDTREINFWLTRSISHVY